MSTLAAPRSMGFGLLGLRTLRLLGALALGVALLFGVSACADEEKAWGESEAVVRAFMDQLKKGNYENAYARFRPNTGIAAMSEADFVAMMKSFEPTGILDFTYEIERGRNDARAKLYNFIVTRTYATAPDLTKAPGEAQNASAEPLFGMSHKTEFIVQNFTGEGWMITSATVARVYDIGRGVREAEAKDQADAGAEK